MSTTLFESDRWHPNVTVAAVIERNGQFLLVEEQSPEGLKLNNPAGHLDEGESPAQGCVRETLEETAHHFTPTSVLGIYLSKTDHPHKRSVTYMRIAFCGELGEFEPDRTLDKGIVRTLWMTPAEIKANVHRLRSPLVLRCIEDFLAGQRLPLNAIYTDPTVQSAKAP